MSEKTEKNMDLQEDYFENKNKELNKQRFVLISKIISVLIILIAVFMIINHSINFARKTNMFNIDNLVIKGNIYLSFNDIIDIIDLKKGDNMFNISLGKLKQALEFHPRIEHVFIKRELPNKIIITLNERKPLVLLNLKKEIGHCLYEIDKNGFIIGEHPYISNYDLPVVTGMEFNNAVPGGQLNDKVFLRILKVLSGIEDKYYDFRRYVAEINIRKAFKNSDITLYLNHYNTRVFFGENFTEDKLRKLNSLLMVIGERISDLEYINFKYDEAIGKYNG